MKFWNIILNDFNMVSLFPQEFTFFFFFSVTNQIDNIIIYIRNL